jgi:hypothetical protein
VARYDEGSVRAAPSMVLDLAAVSKDVEAVVTSTTEARSLELDVPTLIAAMREQHRLLMPDVPPMSEKMVQHIAADLAVRYARLASDSTPEQP